MLPPHNPEPNILAQGVAAVVAGDGHGGQHLAPGQQGGGAGGVASEMDIVLGHYETEFSTHSQSVNVKWCNGKVNVNLLCGPSNCRSFHHLLNEARAGRGI